MSTPTFDQRDSDAARRALDYYFNPAPEASPSLKDMQLVVARNDLSPEAAREHASRLLDCAVCNAWEAAQRMRDKGQDQMLMIMHLVYMAKAMHDHSLSRPAKHDEEPARE